MQSPTDTPFVLQNEEQRAHTLNIIRQSKVMPVLGKDQLEIDNLEKILAEKAARFVENGIYVMEGTARAANYREAMKTLADIASRTEKLIPAWGTHSNIVSIHLATECGIPIAIAADSMPPLAGMYAVPSKQRGDAEIFVQYVKENIQEFSRVLELSDYQVQTLRANPISMDPLAYARARGVIAFPAWSTRAELGGLLARGAETDKVFKFGSLPPSGWNELIAAISSDYDRRGSIGTGGLGIKKIGLKGTMTIGRAEQALIDSRSAVLQTYKEGSYLDTITPCLGTKGFIGAGASDLGKGTVEDVAKRAILYREILKIQH